MMPEQHLQLLMEVFDFDAEDLKANREERISERQLQKIRFRRYLTPSLWIMLFFLIVIINLFVIIMILWGANPHFYGRTFGLIFHFVGGICALLTIYNTLRMRTLDLKYLNGMAILDTWLGNLRHLVKFEDQTFYLSSRQFHALQSGGHYHVRYVEIFPKQYMILSIYPLGIGRKD